MLILMSVTLINPTPTLVTKTPKKNVSILRVHTNVPVIRDTKLMIMVTVPILMSVNLKETSATKKLRAKILSSETDLSDIPVLVMTVIKEMELIV